MYRNLLCWRQSCRHEHCLPHRRLLAYLILASHLYRIGFLFRAPVFLKILRIFWPPERRDVIDQRIKPHVHDVIFIAWHWHTPWHLRFEARYGEIDQSCFDEFLYLIKSKIRNDQRRILFIELKEWLLVF